MRMAIAGWTYFDCTATGVKGNRPSELDSNDWFIKRNQQRNWETIQQCISLRCQPMNLSLTSTQIWNEHRVWCFSFETDRDEIFLLDKDHLGLLLQDCQGVPMIAGLEETWRESFLMPYFITHGDKQNIWFEII